MSCPGGPEAGTAIFSTDADDFTDVDDSNPFYWQIEVFKRHTLVAGYDNGQWKFRVRGPEHPGISTVWPLYANTGVFNGSGGQQQINVESVNVFGPWTIDAEYLFQFSQNAFLPGKPTVGTLADVRHALRAYQAEVHGAVVVAWINE